MLRCGRSQERSNDQKLSMVLFDVHLAETVAVLIARILACACGRPSCAGSSRRVGGNRRHTRPCGPGARRLQQLCLGPQPTVSADIIRYFPSTTASQIAETQ